MRLSFPHPLMVESRHVESIGGSPTHTHYLYDNVQQQFFGFHFEYMVWLQMKHTVDVK